MKNPAPPIRPGSAGSEGLQPEHGHVSNATRPRSPTPMPGPHPLKATPRRRRGRPRTTLPADVARDRSPLFALAVEELSRCSTCGGRCLLPCAACDLARRVEQQGAFRFAPADRPDTRVSSSRPRPRSPRRVRRSAAGGACARGRVDRCCRPRCRGWPLSAWCWSTPDRHGEAGPNSTRSLDAHAMRGLGCGLERVGLPEARSGRVRKRASVWARQSKMPEALGGGRR